MLKLSTLTSRIMNIDAIQRQSIVSLIWQIAFTVIGFFSTVYFARTVGASVLGAYFLFVAYLGIIELITDGGFRAAATKRISEGEEQNEYFSASVALRSVFVSLILVVLIAFRSYFVDLNESGTFIWLLPALIASTLFGTISGGMDGCGKIGIQATSKFINNISRIAAQVVAVFIGFGVAGLTGGFIVGLIVGSIVQLRFFDLRLVHFRWSHIKSLSTFSFWIFLIASGMMVFSTVDTIMIGYYLNNEDVGVYRIVLQFTAFATFTTVALRSALWPRVSNWGKNGQTNLIEESLSRAFTYSFILAVPMLIGGVLLGDKLLYYFYGAEFGRGYITMLVLFIVQIVNIFQILFTAYMSALDELKYLFKVTAIAVAANIVLNAILIPLIGIAGAAIATLVTMGLHSVLALWILSKTLRIKIESHSLINILKASAFMALFLCAYRIAIPLSNVWLSVVPVILGAGVYGLLIVRFDRKIYEEMKAIMIKTDNGAR